MPGPPRSRPCSRIRPRRRPRSSPAAEPPGARPRRSRPPPRRTPPPVTSLTVALEPGQEAGAPSLGPHGVERLGNVAAAQAQAVVHLDRPELVLGPAHHLGDE